MEASWKAMLPMALRGAHIPCPHPHSHPCSPQVCLAPWTPISMFLMSPSVPTPKSPFPGILPSGEISGSPHSLVTSSFRCPRPGVPPPLRGVTHRVLIRRHPYSPSPRVPHPVSRLSRLSPSVSPCPVSPRPVSPAPGPVSRGCHTRGDRSPARRGRGAARALTSRGAAMATARHVVRSMRAGRSRSRPSSAMAAAR